MVYGVYPLVTSQANHHASRPKSPNWPKRINKRVNIWVRKNDFQSRFSVEKPTDGGVVQLDAALNDVSARRSNPQIG